MVGSILTDLFRNGVAEETTARGDGVMVQGESKQRLGRARKGVARIYLAASVRKESDVHLCIVSEFSHCWTTHYDE
jgi:hypothetical protein